MPRRRKVDLRKSLFILPNLFTLSSVLCGFYAILIATAEQASDDAFYRSALLIVFAMFFDTIDGRVARLTKTQSAVGVQLDSLADVISFGVAPGVLVYRWSLHELDTLGILVCFAYIACGTIRLARFNVLTMGDQGAPKKPGKYILGLPIPAAAGILVSLVVANVAARETSFRHVLATPWLIVGVSVALAFFMVSTVRFRSFKDLKLSWRLLGFVLVTFGTTAFIAWRFHISYALVWLLACYIVIAVLETLLSVATGGRHGAARDKPSADSDSGEAAVDVS